MWVWFPTHFKINTFVIGQIPEANNPSGAADFPVSYNDWVYCLDLAVCSSWGILRRLGDVPVITCRSLSRCAEGNVPLRVLLQVQQPQRRSIQQPGRWDVNGWERGRSTEHVARTVRHSGGGVPGRLSSGSPLTGVQSTPCNSSSLYGLIWIEIFHNAGKSSAVYLEYSGNINTHQYPVNHTILEFSTHTFWRK